MNLKNELVQKAVDETLEKLKLFAKPENNSYKKLLKELILECMVKLLEKECFVKVRKADVNYVKSVIKDCESEFVKLMKKETKRDYECKLSILEDDFIEDEYGGVILMNKDAYADSRDQADDQTCDIHRNCEFISFFDRRHFKQIHDLCSDISQRANESCQSEKSYRLRFAREDQDAKYRRSNIKNRQCIIIYIHQDHFHKI